MPQMSAVYDALEILVKKYYNYDKILPDLWTLIHILHTVKYHIDNH